MQFKLSIISLLMPQICCLLSLHSPTLLENGPTLVNDHDHVVYPFSLQVFKNFAGNGNSGGLTIILKNLSRTLKAIQFFFRFTMMFTFLRLPFNVHVFMFTLLGLRFFKVYYGVFTPLDER